MSDAHPWQSCSLQRGWYTCHELLGVLGKPEGSLGLGYMPGIFRLYSVKFRVAVTLYGSYWAVF